MVINSNPNLAASEGRERYKRIAAALAEEVLEYIISHLLPRHKPWLKDGRTWAMKRGDREVRSRTDWILGTDSHMFQNVAVWDTRHNTDHYLVLGCLLRAASATHLRYLGRHTRFPIRPLGTLVRVDRTFYNLKRTIPMSLWQ